jgi:hypothetical protein
LNPNGILLIEMYDGAESLTVVKAILNVGVPRETGEADLDPSEAADPLGFSAIRSFS